MDGNDVDQTSILDLEQDLEDLEAITTQLGWMARRRLERSLETYRLTAPQYMALRCLQKHSTGCSMTELADHAGQVCATMTGIIDRLTESGLVQRQRDPVDRRSLRVILTPQGESLLQQIKIEERSLLRRFMQPLSSHERRMMIALSQRYLDLLKQTLSEEGPTGRPD